MALQNDLKQLRGFLGTIKEQPKCYFKISHFVLDSQDSVFFSLGVYADAAKEKYLLDISSQDLEDSYEGLKFIIDKTGVNYFTQVYQQLKSVQYFEDTIDA